MKNKKGFTLIELLAVIVILAVIALIVVPQVLKVLNKARESAAKDSVYGVAESAESYVANTMLANGGVYPNQALTFECDGSKCELNNASKTALNTLGVTYENTLSIKGKIPTSGTITISANGQVITGTSLVLNSYTCSYENEKADCSGSSSNNSSANNNTPTIGTLASTVHVGDYIEYDPTAGVENPTTNPILQYTSPIGELKVYSGTGDNKWYLVNGASDSATETYNTVYKIIDSSGNFDTTGYTVEADSHGNGNSSQEFQATSDYNIWRVSEVNAQTGVVKISHSAGILSKNGSLFSLSGLRGYKNAVTELNNISAIFGHGTGAVNAHSITIEERNGSYSPTLSDPVTVTVYGDSVERTWNNTGYNYYSDYLGKSISFGIASTAINCSENDHRLTLSLFSQFGNSAVGIYPLWYMFTSTSNGYKETIQIKVMPIVTLQSSVNVKEVSGRDGSTAEKAWQFQ